MPHLVKMTKKIGRFVDSEAFAEYRNLIAQKRGGWDDAWVTDKKFRKSFKGVYYCKFCGKEMYAAEYDDKGNLIMSCRTRPNEKFPKGCPGNIDYPEARKNISHLDYDQRKLTNQYLFNSRCKF